LRKTDARIWITERFQQRGERMPGWFETACSTAGTMARLPLRQDRIEHAYRKPFAQP